MRSKAGDDVEIESKVSPRGSLEIAATRRPNCRDCQVKSAATALMAGSVRGSISAAEWQTHAGLNTYELQQKIPDWLRYGLYPEVLTLDNHEDKRQYLNELTSSYLYKDILEIGNIRYPQKIRQLLSLLAYKLGNLVSIQELANTLQINRETG